MMAAGNIIEIKGLVKRFGDFTAVDGIDLNIKEGEIFGILGPNGAGKTTTINMILGLLKPTKGAITISGMDNQKYKERIKSLIGLMTQETVVEADLTAEENLEIFAELYHTPTDEIPGLITKALKDAELTNFRNKRAGTFSGGMKRRLELVKSMLHSPKILVLDEPTTGLDVQNRSNMWVRIRELRKNGVTVILTTQYLEEADELCDKIAVIDHGKIRAIGTASQLKALVSEGDVLEIITDQANIEKVCRLLKRNSLEPITNVDKVTAILGKNAVRALSKISNEIEKENIHVLSISMHLPTLDDVFIKLTGGGMRDSTSEASSAMTQMMTKSRR